MHMNVEIVYCSLTDIGSYILQKVSILILCEVILHNMYCVIDLKLHYVTRY